MCGIVAHWNYGRQRPPLPEASLVAARETMRRRGPDGAGLWLSPDGRLGLAHRRLAVLDPSPAGAQPMASADGRLRIVYNGEIYNFPVLRDSLAQRGWRFESRSDTEVLLALYALEGPAMLERLRGMYAFALWDEERRGLFLARDPFGIKPLYCADDGDTIWAASQVKALRAAGAGGDKPDPAGRVGFWLWGQVPEPYTLLRDIRSLPAGASLWVDAKGPRKPRAHFSIRQALIEGAAVRGSGAAAATLREAVDESIRCHLVADVPVGLFLSGGVDSGVIAACAGAAARERLHAVTLRFREFEGGPLDEVPAARASAGRWGLAHRVEAVDGTDFTAALPDLFRAMDQPSIDGVNVYFVSRAAAHSGLKVALAGIGGDELFGGYPLFWQIPWLVRLLAPLGPFPVLGRLFRRVSAGFLRRLTSPKYAGLLEYGGSLEGAYLLRRGLFMPWELPRFLDGDLVREGWSELQPLLRLGESTTGIRGTHAALIALEMGWYMRNQLLRDADWAGMAHGVEIRLPYVDAWLFKALAPRLAGSIPPGKRDLARVPREGLAPAVLNRPKAGFAVPVERWLGAAGEDDRYRRGLRGWARRVMAEFGAL